MISLSVAMPAYNEAENIAVMIDRVRDIVGPQVDDLEVVVVNDGSADDTGAIVAAMAAKDPRVRLVEHPVNLGYGAAARDAVWATTKELVFFTDSDLQFDLKELAPFLARQADADLIIGYRYARSDPWYRSLFGHGWSWLVNVMFGHVARDVDCAFKLVHRRVIEGIQVESGGAMFSAEFLIRAKRAGFRSVELPVSHYPRVAGKQTGANPRVILRAFRELFRMRLRLHAEKRARRAGA